MGGFSRGAYRVQIRVAPGDKSRYLWTIYGTQTLFYEASTTSYGSIEQALADASARLAQLS